MFFFFCWVSYLKYAQLRVLTLICLLLHSEITYIDRRKCCSIIVWIEFYDINAKELMSRSMCMCRFFFLILLRRFFLVFNFFFLNVCCVVTTVTLRMPPKLQMNENRTCIERMLFVSRDSSKHKTCATNVHLEAMWHLIFTDPCSSCLLSDRR